MGSSRKIRARRQRRARQRRRLLFTVQVFVEKIIVAPLQTRRRYPLGVTPVVVSSTETTESDVLDLSVRDLSHLVDPYGY